MLNDKRDRLMAEYLAENAGPTREQALEYAHEQMADCEIFQPEALRKVEEEAWETSYANDPFSKDADCGEIPCDVKMVTLEKKDPCPNCGGGMGVCTTDDGQRLCGVCFSPLPDVEAK